MKRWATIVMFWIGLWVGVFLLGAPVLASEVVHKVTVKLEQVEREPALEQEIAVTPAQVFDSAPLAVVWAPAPQGFRFRLYNKQQEPITILWNECAFYDEKGNRHIVTHKGVDRRSNINPDMKGLNSTVIPVGKDWSDVVFPFDSDYILQEKELVNFQKGVKEETAAAYGMAGIRMRPLFEENYPEKNVKKILKKINKKTQTIDFPAYIHGLTYRVELVLKMSENQPKYVYRFYFRAQLNQN